MLDPRNIPADYIESVKRRLAITWEDVDTDEQLREMMLDAEYALNHKLGGEVDYFSAGQERRLYLAYIQYAWNGVLDEFDEAYKSEILQLRHKISIEAEQAQEAGDAS